jgi:hypothetical protein
MALESCINSKVELLFFPRKIAQEMKTETGSDSRRRRGQDGDGVIYEVNPKVKRTSSVAPFEGAMDVHFCFDKNQPASLYI